MGGGGMQAAPCVCVTRHKVPIIVREFEDEKKKKCGLSYFIFFLNQENLKQSALYGVCVCVCVWQ